MKFQKIFLIILLSFISQESLSQQCHSLNSLQWLLGDWVADNGETVTLESWKQVSDKTFEGFGETNVKSANVRQSSELLRLVELNNEVFYIAKPNQNEFPTAFKLMACSSKLVIFENPKHDFPTKLIYELTDVNSLRVIVSGRNGKSFTIEYNKHGNR